MKLYLAITDFNTYILAANSPWEAEARVIAKDYPALRDDDLSDRITIEQIDKDDIPHLRGGDIKII